MYFLKSPLKNHLIASLILASVVACEMDEQPSLAEESKMHEESIIFDVLSVSGMEPEDQSNLRVSGNVLHEINFTETNPFANLTTQFSSSHSFQTITNPLDSRDKSGKFELRYSDRVRTTTTNSARSEILLPAQSHNERWYAFSVYFPNEGFSSDRLVESITQWHQAGGGSPPNAVQIENDEIYLRSINRSDTRDNSNKVYTNYSLGRVERGKWNEFVFRFIHSPNQNGLIEIWKNGQKVHRITGPNIRRGFELPRLKIGIYKWLWASGKTGGTTRRVLYYDNIKIGSENASLSEMRSSLTASNSQIITENKESISTGSVPDITGFTLIAAGPDTEIGAISPASTMYYRNNKLNIQANMARNFNGHVKFEMKGGYSYSYIDRQPPFTLFGDDGKGNYYFGRGLDPGTYTVTATPIDGSSIGKSKTITFTIRKN